jgi:hypothetical protein
MMGLPGLAGAQENRRGEVGNGLSRAMRFGAPAAPDPLGGRGRLLLGPIAAALICAHVAICWTCGIG